MRRFVAYLSLAIAGIATIGATFNSALVNNTTSNIEYDDGQAMVFKLSNKDDNDELKDENAADNIADIMQKRLDLYGESRYEVVTMGNDMVKVIVSEENNPDRYGDIQSYLSFNGVFALGTKDSKTVAVDEEFLIPGEAHVEFVNYYPTVVIPVKTTSENFKTVIKEAEDHAANTPEPEEGQQKEQTFVYLAYNWDADKDSMANIEKNEDEASNKTSEKLLLKFDIEHIWLDDEKNAIATSVNIANEDGTTSIQAVEKATYTANYTVNLLNSEPLPYEVTCINMEPVPAYFENIISVYNNVAWSRTLTATLFAILILSLLLAVFFRWGAVAIAALSLASTYLGLLLSLVFTVEFNTALIIGLCGVALASILSGIIYFTKVKEECYRGRTLKKANAEGAKRALLPIVDVNVILIIIGACVYWLGGTLMTSFAAATVFGGIFSLIFNTLALKGLAWLLTNTTKFQGKYSIIGVENAKVPNLMNEEVQSYYGPYQDSKPTKHKKSIGIAALVLLVASVVGTVTFGALNNGTIFNDKGMNVENSYLYIQSNSEQFSDKTKINELFQYTEYIEKKEEGAEYTESDWEKAKNLEYTIDQFDHITPAQSEGETAKTTHYVVLKIEGNFNQENYIFRTFASEDDQKENNAKYTGSLESIFNEFNTNVADDQLASAQYRIGKIVNEQQPNYRWIIVACATAVGFVALYLMLRYGLSRGIVSILAATLVGFITAGIFTLTRVIVGLDLFIALPLIMFFVLASAIILMDKDKEMIRDDLVKSKDNSIEHHIEISNKANALALGPILIFTAMAVYLMVNFFGFGTAATANVFMFTFVGVVLSAVAIIVLYNPMVHLIYKLLRKMNIKKPDLKKPHKKNKKKVVKAKSAEPEEAIFIGIND